MPSKVLWIAADRSPVPDGILGMLDVSFAVAPNVQAGLEFLGAEEFDSIVAGFPIPDCDPETFFDQIRHAAIETPVILYAPAATLTDAVLWTKLGAHEIAQDSCSTGQAIDEIARSRQIRVLAGRLAGTESAAWRRMLIGRSQKMHNIAEIVRLVAPRRCTVLITGETGTGKEVVARAIHAAGNRSQYEMVSINCSALPENLLEAELFGHVKGAFTGAAGPRTGRFEQAHRGTLFLDEVGDMPLTLQAKLLRVLQEREFQRLGSSETVHIDVRVIAATNANLAAKVKTREFREDLYYRLNVVPIALPPLRDRPGDIPHLVGHFLQKICQEEDIPRKSAPEDVLNRLSRQDWPGNVRELENSVAMAVALSGDRQILYASDFPLPVRTRISAGAVPFVAVPDHGLDFERTVGSIELNILEQALRKTGGNKKLAADMLRLKRTTLAAKLKTLSGTADPASCERQFPIAAPLL